MTSIWIKAQNGNLLNLNRFDEIHWRDQSTASREDQRGYVIVASLTNPPAEEVIGICKTKEDLAEKMANLQHIVGADQKLF